MSSMDFWAKVLQERDEWKAEADSLRERLREALSKRLAELEKQKFSENREELLGKIFDALQDSRRKLGFEEMFFAGGFSSIPEVIRADAEALKETLELCSKASRCQHGCLYICQRCAGARDEKGNPIRSED